MPTLEDLLNLKTEIGKLTTQRDGLLASVEQATQQLARTQQEATQKAAAILAEAKAEADQSRSQVAEKQQELTQREADVASREKAVEWVDAKITELNDRAEALLQAEQLAEQARADARAQQQHWVSKMDELKAKEDALALREQALIVREQAAPVVNVSSSTTL